MSTPDLAQLVRTFLARLDTVTSVAGMPGGAFSNQWRASAQGELRLARAALNCALVAQPAEKPAAPLATDAGVALSEYTAAIGEAGQRYMSTFPYAHPLPGTFRWQELWDVMRAAAHPAAERPAQGEVKGRDLSRPECEALTQEIRNASLSVGADYVDVRNGGEDAVLDGTFTIADLETILRLWKAAIA